MVLSSKRVALVTGASSGIGKSAASALVDAGFVVVGTSRRATGAAPASGVDLIELDVTNDASVETAVDDVITRHGRIDVLVNNAGFGSVGAAEETSIAQAQMVFDVNVFGVMRMVKAVLPHMRARGTGHIINVSSVQGFMPAPFMAVYGASKHAIEGYSQSLDHEVRQYGIRSILVEPAYTKTAFEASSTRPDALLPAYTEQRDTFARVMAKAIEAGDEPAVVAEVIVKAAINPTPKLRYTAGRLAGSASMLTRFAPVGTFDKQIRKMNQLPR
ncbi:oxidoreductase [Microbacterium sp. cx-55]|uniref:oxidoreductase n=1 Tax=Microbacterium sp. cx-55 TaxID=2875948 RepID=UPI001CBE6930|nr:oxidoreductase [Microbacterium sp. cx-55]MBZ4486709.1 oxidoreductase [Microbacterium sp. cx-55]UGB36331.1 oxidoreductase [Microbacterium sp. cx-55]